jgi:hypothetical protein
MPIKSLVFLCLISLLAPIWPSVSAANLAKNAFVRNDDSGAHPTILSIAPLALTAVSTVNMTLQKDSLSQSSEYTVAAPNTMQALSYRPLYLSPDPNGALMIPQEIKNQVIVTNGNFLKWMKFADTLKTKPIDSIKNGDHKNTRPTWIIATILVLMFAIAMVRRFFPLDFYVIVEAYFKDRLLQQVSKEDNMATSWPYIFLYIIFSFTLGLFLLMLDAYANQSQSLLTFNNFFKVSLIVGVLFIVKILFIRFVSFIFELNKLVREYIAVLYLVYFNSMLILLPAVLILSLLPTAYFTIIISLSIILIFILFIYRFLRTAFHLFGNLRFSIFYLILYLCCLEIAPILILVRTLSK